MSLDWNVGKVKDFDKWGWVKDEAGEEVLNPLTDRLIWATMAVELGDITEKNADEFYIRLQTLGYRFGSKGYATITREDVRKHIGLKTNVSNETRKSWLRERMKRVEGFMEHETRQLKQEDEDRERTEVSA